VVDVTSTGLFMTDPVLKRNGATADCRKTGAMGAAEGGRLRHLGRFAAVGCILLAAPLAAQEPDGGDGPLRFLRPSVGIEPAQPAPEPQPEIAAREPPSGESGDGPVEAEVPGAPAGDPDRNAAPAAVPTEPRRPQALRLGVLGRRDATATLRALGPFADALGDAIGRPVELVPMASFAAMIDAQSLGRIDGGFFSAAAYAVAEARCQCLEPIVAPAAADGTAAYHAVIVTPADGGPDTLADLKGKRVGAGAADSVGSRLLPVAALRSEGVEAESFFAEVVAMASAEEAVRAVLEGEVEAAFAWTSLSRDLGSGYSRGTLADMVARGVIDPDELAIVWRSPPLGHGPFAVSRSLPEAEKARLEAFLIDLEARDPDAYDALNPYYSGGYVAVNAEDYAGAALLARGEGEPGESDEPGASD
jgi:phosphonate transport system substrate-binding protein